MALLAALTVGCGQPTVTPDTPASPPLESAEHDANGGIARDVADPTHPGTAWTLRQTSTGRIVAQHQPAHLDTRVLPGSVAKVITALAALEQGHGDLRVACSRRLTLHGRDVHCVHPVRAAPFTLTEALAQSCNTFFARLGGRLDRVAWQRLASRIGAPADDGAARPDLLAIGLEGPTASAATWHRLVVRALTGDVVPVAHRHVLRAGLRAAVDTGTAAPVQDAWSDTLAKTATVVEAGRTEGLAVVVRPEEDLDLVVRVRGGAGGDAAAVAAAVLEAETPDLERVRLGHATSDVESLALDTYVGRVVAAEATPDMPEAALEALAIAARTYAVARRDRHADEGFDLCDLTHCQAVTSRVWPAATRAAERTRAVVLAHAGRIVPVYYSAACAGRLHDPRDVWGGDTASGEYVGIEPHAHPVPAWHADVTEPALTAALRGAGLTGDGVRDLRVHRAADEALPRTVDLDGFSPRRLTADAFRTIVGRALGWDVLKSHTWTATRTAAGFRFEGRGKGHGVGLCVAGATAAARQAGPTAQAADVLADYYPTLRLRSLADTVRLRLTLASQGPAAALLQDTQTALVELRQRLRMGAPRTIDIVEHPTIEAYQRATGRAWWTGGSTRVPSPTVARIDLPPLSTLERAGRVRTRLRHELTHALTEASLRDAPLWVREGLAVHLARDASEHVAHATDASRCPSDDELAHPGGSDAMREVYGRAGDCVAQALAAGVPWRSIR